LIDRFQVILSRVCGGAGEAVQESKETAARGSRRPFNDQQQLLSGT